jgi:hypothetical protein
MAKPPASLPPGQRRRRDRPPSSLSASTCAGAIAFWSVLAGAFYLLSCWSGVRVDESSEMMQSVFPTGLRLYDDSRPRYQMLAAMRQPSRRYGGWWS